MKNSATQNPDNKVGRNSGGRPAGVTEVVPTPQEAARGVEPLQIQQSAPQWGTRRRRLRLGIGAVAIAGAGLASFVSQRAKRNRTLSARLRRAVGLR